MEPRKEVSLFAMEMERKLQENDHKGGWANCDPKYLIERLKEEVDELSRAMFPKCSCRGCADCNHMNIPSVNKVVGEAADIANFAMMIADIFRVHAKSRMTL